jgi:hypothetical protein
VNRVKSVDEATERGQRAALRLVAYAFINAAEGPSDGVEVGNLSINHRGKATAAT